MFQSCFTAFRAKARMAAFRLRPAISRAHQTPLRRPMDLACHHLETIRQETMTRKTSQTMEIRPVQILEVNDLAEAPA